MFKNIMLVVAIVMMAVISVLAAAQPAFAGKPVKTPKPTIEKPVVKDPPTADKGKGTQGNSPSAPDQDGRGPDRDNPVDPNDTDGNNGCGNDSDRMDDNEGWCGRKPKSSATPVPSKTPVPTAPPTTPITDTTPTDSPTPVTVPTKDKPGGVYTPTATITTTTRVTLTAPITKTVCNTTGCDCEFLQAQINDQKAEIAALKSGLDAANAEIVSLKLAVAKSEPIPVAANNNLGFNLVYVAGIALVAMLAATKKGKK